MLRCSSILSDETGIEYAYTGEYEIRYQKSSILKFATADDLLAFADEVKEAAGMLRPKKEREPLKKQGMHIRRRRRDVDVVGENDGREKA